MPPAWFSWDPCLPYFTGALVLIIGLSMVIKNDALRSHGVDKIILLGPVFMAVPVAIFGTDHFQSQPGRSVSQALLAEEH